MIIGWSTCCQYRLIGFLHYSADSDYRFKNRLCPNYHYSLEKYPGISIQVMKLNFVKTRLWGRCRKLWQCVTGGGWNLWSTCTVVFIFSTVMFGSTFVSLMFHYCSNFVLLGSTFVLLGSSFVPPGSSFFPVLFHLVTLLFHSVLLFFN